MKKLVLLFTGLLMGLTTVTAETKSASKGEDLTINRYNYSQPIVFVERGVEFLIFPDGTFDFNTELDYTQGESYYRRNTKRRNVNVTFGAPGTQVRYSTRRPRGVIVKHDHLGRVRRIGNVFLNYNRHGQIKRAGSVYIGYNRRGLARQIGGLFIKYNRRGHIIRITGQVNRNNAGCGFCGASGCQIDHYQGHGHNNDWDDDDDDWDDDDDDDDDDDYYYYRKGKRIKKGDDDD